MNKKTILAALTLSTALLSGLNSVSAASSAPVVPATSAASTSVSIVDPTAIRQLNHSSAIPLVVEAEKRYFYAMRGGASAGDTFELKQREYRYLSADIGTRAKLLAYLSQSFTTQASKYYIDKYFIEHDGRMAQLNADGGNLLQFDKATALLIAKTAESRIYRLTVPYPKGLQGPERMFVNFRKENGAWRVNTAPHKLGSGAELG